MSASDLKSRLTKAVAKSKILDISEHKTKKTLSRIMSDWQKEVTIEQFVRGVFAVSEILQDYNYANCEWYIKAVDEIIRMLSEPNCPEYILAGLTQSRVLGFEDIYWRANSASKNALSQGIVENIGAIHDSDFKLKVAVSSCKPMNNTVIKLSQIYQKDPESFPTNFVITQDINDVNYNNKIFEDAIYLICKRYNIDVVCIEPVFTSVGVHIPISEDMLPYVLFENRTLYIRVTARRYEEKYKNEMYLYRVQANAGILSFTYRGIKNSELLKTYKIDLARAVYYTVEAYKDCGQMKMCI